MSEFLDSVDLPDDALEDFDPPTDCAYDFVLDKVQFRQRPEDDRFNPGGFTSIWNFRFDRTQSERPDLGEYVGGMATQVWLDIAKGRNSKYKSFCKAVGADPESRQPNFEAYKGMSVRGKISKALKDSKNKSTGEVEKRLFITVETIWRP